MSGLIALLTRAGAGAGRPIAAVTRSSAVIARLAEAAPALGCPLFPLDPALEAATLAALLAGAGVGAGAGLVVADDGVAVEGDVGAAEILAQPTVAPLPPSRLGADDVALLIATTGSTGAPKAAMLSAGNLAASADASARRLPLGVGDRWLACLPLCHIGGFSILTRCRRAGATPALQEGFEPHAVARTLARAAITHLSLVPVMLIRLLDAVADAPPPPRLRHVLVGGAALAGEVMERAVAAGWPVRPSYGMTETASQIATLALPPRPWPQGLVGRPLDGAEVALTPDGRLKIRGPMVMAGYANPELRPGDGLVEGWLETRDLAEIRPGGELVILGRADDVIVSGGRKVHPIEVENGLARCPGVTLAAVAGRPDPLWGEVVAAAYTGPATPDHVEAWSAANLPPRLRPRWLVAVEAPPLTANGKIDRQALRRLLADHPQPRPGGQP